MAEVDTEGSPDRTLMGSEMRPSLGISAVTALLLGS